MSTEKALFGLSIITPASIGSSYLIIQNQEGFESVKDTSEDNPLEQPPAQVSKASDAPTLPDITPIPAADLSETKDASGSSTNQETVTQIEESQDQKGSEDVQNDVEPARDTLTTPNQQEENSAPDSTESYSQVKPSTQDVQQETTDTPGSETAQQKQEKTPLPFSSQAPIETDTEEPSLDKTRDTSDVPPKEDTPQTPKQEEGDKQDVAESSENASLGNTEQDKSETPDTEDNMGLWGRITSTVSRYVKGK